MITIKEQFSNALTLAEVWGFQFDETIELNADGTFDDRQLAHMLQTPHPKTKELFMARIAEAQQLLPNVVALAPDFFSACDRLSQHMSADLPPVHGAEFSIVDRKRQQRGKMVPNGLFSFLEATYPGEIHRRKSNRKEFFKKSLPFAELGNPHLSIDDDLDSRTHPNPLYQPAHYSASYQGKQYRIYYDMNGGEFSASVTDENGLRVLSKEELAGLRQALHLDEARAALAELMLERNAEIDNLITKVNILTAIGANKLDAAVTQEHTKHIEDLLEKVAVYSSPKLHPGAIQLQERKRTAYHQWHQQRTIETEQIIPSSGGGTSEVKKPKKKKGKSNKKKAVFTQTPEPDQTFWQDNYQHYLERLHSSEPSIATFLELLETREELSAQLTEGYIQFRQHEAIKAALEDAKQYQPLVNYLLRIDQAALAEWIATDNRAFLSFFQQVISCFYLNVYEDPIITSEPTSEYEQQLIGLIALAYEASDKVKAMIQSWHRRFLPAKMLFSGNTHHVLGDLLSYMIFKGRYLEYIQFSIQQGLFPVNQLGMIINNQRFTHAQLAYKCSYSVSIVKLLAEQNHDFFTKPVIPDSLLTDNNDFDFFCLVHQTYFLKNPTISAAQFIHHQQRGIEWLCRNSHSASLLSRLELLRTEEIDFLKSRISDKYLMDTKNACFKSLPILNQFMQLIAYFRWIHWVPTLHIESQNFENPISYQSLPIKASETKQLLHFEPSADVKDLTEHQFRIITLLLLNGPFSSLTDYLKHLKQSENLPDLIAKIDEKIEQMSSQTGYEFADEHLYCLNLAKLMVCCYDQNLFNQNYLTAEMIPGLQSAGGGRSTPLLDNTPSSPKSQC